MISLYSVQRERVSRLSIEIITLHRSEVKFLPLNSNNVMAWTVKSWQKRVVGDVRF